MSGRAGAPMQLVPDVPTGTPMPLQTAPARATASLLANDIATWRRAGIGFTGLGAGGLVLSSQLPATSAHDERVFLVATVVSVAMAGLFHLLRGARERWFAPVSNLVLVLFVCGLVATLEHTAGFAFFLVWPLLSVAMLLPARVSIAAGAATFGLLGAALALRPDGMDVLMWLNVGMVNLVASAAVRGLRGGRDRIFEQLREAAEHDGLTGVHNRATFERLAERLLARAAHGGEPLALVLFDIDHFKQLNDGHGHAAGDAALRGFAEILRSQSRPADVLARVGGEEFAVLMPGATPDDARRFAERVGDALRGSRAQGVAITVSAGVAAPSAPGDGVEELARAADHALYTAKAAGRDRVVVAEPAPAAPAARAGDPVGR